MVQPALAASSAGRAATCDTAAPGGARARRPADPVWAARRAPGRARDRGHHRELQQPRVPQLRQPAAEPGARPALPRARRPRPPPWPPRPSPISHPVPYPTTPCLPCSSPVAARAPSCTTLLPAACLPALRCRGAPLPSAVRPPALRCGAAPSWRAGGSGKGGRGVLQHALAPAGAPAQVGAPARTACSAAAAHGSLSVAPGVLRRATRAPRT